MRQECWVTGGDDEGEIETGLKKEAAGRGSSGSSRSSLCQGDK